jgi:hypothetical protein
MEDQSTHWKDIIFSVGALVVVFVLGGYFGYRIQESQNFSRVAQLQSEVIIAQSQESDNSSEEIIPIEVPEVYWLSQGGESQCPQSHPIKAKFTSTGNVAYTPENKSYKRVRAHICLINAEFATDSAGFFIKQN